MFPYPTPPTPRHSTGLPTLYEHGGTTVETIDPKGKWKKFAIDALGSRIRVWEPHPGKGLNPDTVTQVHAPATRHEQLHRHPQARTTN